MAIEDAIPRTPLLLGLGGLIPFVASAGWLVFGSTTQAPLALQSLSVYGAVILSFLGGVRWGVRVDDRKAVDDVSAMLWSVIPSLIAWVALLLPATITLLVLMAGFVVQYWRDRQAAVDGELPGWFGRLRLLLTMGAMLSLGIGAVSL